MKMLSFNRTIVELKPGQMSYKARHAAPFNRTILELKRLELKSRIYPRGTELTPIL